LRVGIFGGVFNPPHIGHLIEAQEALLQLELEMVVFIPAGRAPHREIEDDPGPEARLEMCEYAVGPDDRFGLSRIEVDRPGPSYTVDTLRELRDQRPDDELHLILGGDAAADIASWREPEEVLRLAAVAVAERTGWRREPITVKMAGLKGAERVRFFEMPRIDISSTMVRRRVAAGKPIRYLVPDRVAEYIAERGLYGAAQGAAASA
jgi:nicotinate-nucleotide adenylyltransferase